MTVIEFLTYMDFIEIDETPELGTIYTNLRSNIFVNIVTIGGNPILERLTIEDCLNEFYDTLSNYKIKYFNFEFFTADEELELTLKVMED